MQPQVTIAEVVWAAARLGGAAAITASAWAIGATAWRRWGPDETEGRWALATALGMGLLAQAMLVLGLLGLIRTPWVVGLLVAGNLLSVGTWRAALVRRREAHDGMPRRLAVRVAVLVLVAVGPAWLALYPPTAFDATAYHLPFARAFVETGGMPFLPDLRFPVFPQAVEVGFAMGMVLGGDTVAALTQVLCLAAVAALVWTWARRSRDDIAGDAAAALWLGTPLVLWMAWSRYIGVELTLFVTAGLYCWERFRESGDRRWLAPAGAFVGFAAASKYLGLFFVGWVVSAATLRSVRLRSGRPALVVATAALLVAAPWYARIVALTGNPVFPFYAPVFGSSAWSTAHDQQLFGTGEAAAGEPTPVGMSGLAERVLDRAVDLVRTPWRWMFARERLNRPPPLSPVHVVLLLLCLPPAVADPRCRRHALLVAAYALFWLTTVRDIRFVVPLIPVLGVMLAAGWSWWAGRVRMAEGATAGAAVALALLATGPLYAGYKIHETGPLPVGDEARAAYLDRMVRGHGAVRWLNQRHGRHYVVYALPGERLHYYARGRLLGDWFGPNRYSRIQSLLDDPAAAAAELRRLGADFLLVAGRREGMLRTNEAFHRELQPCARGPGWRLFRVRADA